MNVSPERLRRFFVRTSAGYQVVRSIRDVCVFSRHNVANDPPLSRMNLISCRNLLIYLSPALQKRVLSMFGYALEPSGYLILGQSETVRDYADYFQTVDERQKIYCKKPDVPQTAFRPTDNIGDYAPEYFKLQLEPPADETSGPAWSVLERVDQIVLSRYGPAGLVVEDSLRIVEYRGGVTQFLVQPEPRIGAYLTDVVADDLRLPLGAAIDDARRNGIEVIAENIPNSGAATAHLDVITVIPLSPEGTLQHFLILFGDSRKRTAAPAIAPENAWSDGEETPLDGLARENARLRIESKASREYLQSVIEELRSTNDEAQAANEELQSANEEMQTSKEELQASNEELNTVNAEMQSRNAELARLNDDLINLFGSMNTPIVMIGNDLRIRRYTQAAEKVLSLIPADIGRSIADLRPRIGVANLEEIFQSVLDTLQPHEQEIQDRDGRFYLMRVRPYRTSDNRIDGAVLKLFEVSELKRSMEEVQYARDYAEAIVNTVREPLVVLDRNLVIRNANPAFYDALDLTQGTAIGRGLHEVARGRLDLPQVHTLLERIHTEAADFSEVEIEFRAGEAHDRDARVLLLNARRLSTPDRKQLVLLAFRDITERKRAADARYRRLFESARDGIVLVDADTGVILDLNPFTEQLLGYTRDEIANRKIWEIEPIQTVPKVRAAIERIRDQGYFRLDDLPLRTKDGREIQTEMIASVYSEGDRRAIQFNIRDESERRKFEHELQESQKLESLGLLAGGIAHDFNNLLTSILGHASLAYSEVPGNQKVRNNLREIMQASERAAFLTRQMLAYAGRGRVSLETIDISALIVDISALARSSMPRAVELRLELAEGLPPIEADPAQMQQVVMNLIVNAGEAIGKTQSGRIEIRTALRELNPSQMAEFFGPGQSAGGVYVQLEVTDNGSGMDEATKARIFDPFFSTKFAGRGLGLAAVQGILRGHAGAIRVYSTPGHGSSFLVLLPASNRRPRVTSPEKAASSRIHSGKVVLVVDDEEAVRGVVSSVLSREGLKVLTAENGRIAVELFQEHNAIISVVLLDLQMPVLGGEEAFRLMHRINPNVPVILSSGYDESEAAGRFSGTRPAGFLQKPYTTERLIEAIGAMSSRPN